MPDFVTQGYQRCDYRTQMTKLVYFNHLYVHMATVFRISRVTRCTPDCNYTIDLALTKWRTSLMVNRHIKHSGRVHDLFWHVKSKINIISLAGSSTRTSSSVALCVFVVDVVRELRLPVHHVFGVPLVEFLFPYLFSLLDVPCGKKKKT